MSFDEEHLDDHYLCQREVAERDQRIRELEAAIRWALGEEGEFPDEPPQTGTYRKRYWWRTELRRRAALECSAPSDEGEADGK